MFKLVTVLAIIATYAGISLAVDGEPQAGLHFVTRTIGNMEVTALLDARGIGQGSADLLVGAGPEDLERAKVVGALDTSVNAFLVRRGDTLMLFDTGNPITDETGIMQAIAEAGYSPDDIDVILITHFHRDHVGGLIKDGQKVYPKSEIAVPKAGVDRWSGPEAEFLYSYNIQTNVFDHGREIYPGVTAMAASGHTPGHTVFVIESGGEKLLILGDLIHLAGVQLPNPDVAVTYDVDPGEAVKARRRFFDMAAEQELTVASMHIPFPGMGVLAKDGKGYVFNELN